MEDVTAAVARVRMCLRDLWNGYLRRGEDLSSYPHELEDLFGEIEARLFGALLLFDLDRLAFTARFGLEPLPFLIVVPTSSETPLLINRPSTDGNRYWDAFDGRVGPTDVTLHFIEWFDWDRYGQRKFQYYLVRVHAFERYPEFVERDALIECHTARILVDPSVGS